MKKKNALVYTIIHHDANNELHKVNVFINFIQDEMLQQGMYDWHDTKSQMNMEVRVQLDTVQVSEMKPKMEAQTVF